MKCEINGMVQRAEVGFLQASKVKIGKTERDVKHQLIGKSVPGR